MYNPHLKSLLILRVILVNWFSGKWYLSTRIMNTEMPTVTDSPYLFRFSYSNYGVTVTIKRLRKKQLPYMYIVYCSWVWRWQPIKHADRLVISSLTNRGCASLRTGHCMPPWIPYFSFATAMGVAFQQINLEFTSWNKPTNDGKSNRTKCLHFGNVILASCWWILILTLIGCCAIRDVMNLQRS